MNPDGDTIRKIQADIEWHRLSLEEIANKWEVPLDAVRWAYRSLIRANEDRDRGLIDDGAWPE